MENETDARNAARLRSFTDSRLEIDRRESGLICLHKDSKGDSGEAGFAGDAKLLHGAAHGRHAPGDAHADSPAHGAPSRWHGRRNAPKRPALSSHRRGLGGPAACEEGPAPHQARDPQPTALQGAGASYMKKRSSQEGRRAFHPWESNTCARGPPPCRSSGARRPHSRQSRSLPAGPRPRPSWGRRGGRCWLTSSRSRGLLGGEAARDRLSHASHSSHSHLAWLTGQCPRCPKPAPALPWLLATPPAP